MPLDREQRAVMRFVAVGVALPNQQLLVQASGARVIDEKDFSPIGGTDN
jgi:hypothetical protein